MENTALNLSKQVQVESNLAKRRIEGEKRLKLLIKQGVFDATLRVFRNDDVSLFENIGEMSIHYFIKNNIIGENVYSKIWNKIQEFESKNNFTVYLVSIDHTNFGTLLTMFYVSDEEENWPRERRELLSKTPYTYVYNLDCEEFSEFGYIKYKINKIFGGIKRIG